MGHSILPLDSHMKDSMMWITKFFCFNKLVGRIRKVIGSGPEKYCGSGLGPCIAIEMLIELPIDLPEKDSMMHY